MSILRRITWSLRKRWLLRKVGEAIETNIVKERYNTVKIKGKMYYVVQANQRLINLIKGEVT